MDKVEEKLKKIYYKKPDFDHEAKLRELIDQKIESVVTKLAIPRNCVHIIENYHENKENSDVRIDYYALKLLKEAVEQGDAYISLKISEKTEKCAIF